VYLSKCLLSSSREGLLSPELMADTQCPGPPGTQVASLCSRQVKDKGPQAVYNTFPSQDPAKGNSPTTHCSKNSSTAPPIGNGTCHDCHGGHCSPVDGSGL
jgi:hypothetical protein